MIGDKKFTVYGLRDPTSETIRYVGVTKQSLGMRLRSHIGEARITRRRSLRLSPKNSWILDLIDRGLRPEIVCLDSDASVVRERHWIDALGKDGSLLNVTPGGDGFPGSTTVNNHVKQTHCKRGHEFNNANTRINARGARECRRCDRVRYLARKANGQASP